MPPPQRKSEALGQGPSASTQKPAGNSPSDLRSVPSSQQPPTRETRPGQRQGGASQGKGDSAWQIDGHPPRLGTSSSLRLSATAVAPPPRRPGMLEPLVPEPLVPTPWHERGMPPSIVAPGSRIEPPSAVLHPSTVAPPSAASAQETKRKPPRDPFTLPGAGKWGLDFYAAYTGFNTDAVGCRFYKRARVPLWPSHWEAVVGPILQEPRGHHRKLQLRSIGANWNVLGGLSVGAGMMVDPVEGGATVYGKTRVKLSFARFEFGLSGRPEWEDGWLSRLESPRPHFNVAVQLFEVSTTGREWGSQTKWRVLPSA